MTVEAGAYVMSTSFCLMIVWFIWVAWVCAKGPQPITRGRYVSIEQMRAAISAAYPGPRWTRRVMNMADKQIAATYMRLMEAGKLQGRNG